LPVADGGEIKQVIVADKLEKNWLSRSITVFNVQVLNSVVYKAVTGEDPPTKPIDVNTNKQHGPLFFKIYEEPSGISGQFSQVKPIAKIDGSTEGMVKPAIVEIGPSAAAPIPRGQINPLGPLRSFRTVSDLKKEYSGYHVVSF
jgi:hypothetical protein